MVILDTDHLTIIQRRSEPAYSCLVTRLREVSSNEIFSTIVSFEEQMRGWPAVIGRAKRVSQEIIAYRHLHALFHSLAQFQYSNLMRLQPNAIGNCAGRGFALAPWT